MKKTPDYERDIEFHDLSSLQFADYRANNIMRSLYEILQPHFGITSIGPYLTLRWKGKDKEHLEVSFMVTNIHDESQFEYVEDK